MLIGSISSVGFFIVVVVVVWLALRSRQHERELLHRERMSALEQGIDLPIVPEFKRMKLNPLRTALILIAVGLGLTFALLIAIPPGALGDGVWAWGAFVAIIGAGNLVWWFVGGKEEHETDRRLREELTRAQIERLRAGAPKNVDPSGL